MISRVLLILALLAVAPLAAEARDLTVSESRLCQRIRDTYAQNTAALQRAQVRAYRRFGVRCSESISRSRSVVAATSGSTAANGAYMRTTMNLDAYREFEQRLQASMQPGTALFTQAQSLTDALEAYMQLSPAEQSAVLPALVRLGIEHMSNQNELTSRIRYNNNLAVLTGIVKQGGDDVLMDSVRSLVANTLLQQETGESSAQFALRRQYALHMWDQRQIVVYYWPGTPVYSGQLPSNLPKHYDLLSAITSLGGSAFPPGSEYLHLIMVRDDVGATASKGAVWLPTHSSIRTFIHEVGHVVHDTKPALLHSFAEYEALYNQSAEHDYITSYHTDHREDFAELFTEYAFGGSTDIHPVDRAISQARTGQPLLLRKVQYLLSNVFSDPAEAVWQYEVDSSDVSKKSVQVMRDRYGRITAVRWRGEWVVF